MYIIFFKSPDDTERIWRNGKFVIAKRVYGSNNLYLCLTRNNVWLRQNPMSMQNYIWKSQDTSFMIILSKTKVAPETPKLH